MKSEEMSMATWCCSCRCSFSVIKSAHSPDNSLQFSRRSSAALLISALPFSFLSVSLPPPVLARARRLNSTIPLQDYLTSLDGLKYYDLVEGKGPIAEKGSTVRWNYGCI